MEIVSVAYGPDLLRYAARRGFHVLKEVTMPQVLIRREKDGREYEIASGDFKRGKHFMDDDGEMRTFEAAGFRIVSLADGSPYEPPERHAPAATTPSTDDSEKKDAP